MRGSKWFWEHVDKTSKCWEWTGQTLRGEPVVFGHRNMTAKRFAYLDLYPDKPARVRIKMNCGNPMCVRPSHMAVGKWAKTGPREKPLVPTPVDSVCDEILSILDKDEKERKNDPIQ